MDRPKSQHSRPNWRGSVGLSGCGEPHTAIPNRSFRSVPNPCIESSLRPHALCRPTIDLAIGLRKLHADSQSEWAYASVERSSFKVAQGGVNLIDLLQRQTRS